MKQLIFGAILLLFYPALKAQSTPAITMNVIEFCEGEEVLIRGTDFFNSANLPTHAWDITEIWIGGQVWIETSSNASSNNSGPDSIWVLPPAGTAINSPYEALQLMVNKKICIDSNPNDSNPCNVRLTLQDSINIVIHNPNVSVSYAAPPYCQGSVISPPAVMGDSGGVFSSPTLPIDPILGSIPLNSVNPGNNYQMTYTTAHPHCPEDFDIFIDVLATAFNVLTYSGLDSLTLCPTGNLQPDPGGLVATQGTFSSNPPGLFPAFSNGSIDLGQASPGTYTINYSGNSGCSIPGQAVLTILPLDSANIVYLGALSGMACVNDTLLIPLITYGSGGTFQAGDPGLNMSALGVIDPGQSDPGVYNNTYQTAGLCPDTIQLPPITIIENSNPHFSLTNDSLCGTDLPLHIDSIAALSGQFNLLNNQGAILELNPITPIQMQPYGPGSYILQRVVPGFCKDTFERPFAILPVDDASFNYLDDHYCRSGSSVNPFIGNQGGGIFSCVSLGNVLDTVTGQILLDTAPIGIHIITYQTNGLCPSTSYDTIEIHGVLNADFSYPGSQFCLVPDSLIQLASLPDSGGVFSANPAGLSLHPINGTIDLEQSDAGTYEVFYSLPNCQTNTSLFIELDGVDNSIAISIPADSFCQTLEPLLPSLVFDSVYGIPHGAWTLEDLGTNMEVSDSIINSVSGIVYLENLDEGTYELRYEVQGCGVERYDTFEVVVTPSISLMYPIEQVCADAGEQVPFLEVSPLEPGGFQASPMGLAWGSGEGVIDVDNSLAGEYEIVYRTQGFCPNSVVLPFVIHPLSRAFSLDVSPQNVLCEGDSVRASLFGLDLMEWGFLWEDSVLTLSDDYTSEYFTPGDSNSVLAWAETIHGCRDTLGLNFTVNPKPFLVANDTPAVIGRETTSFLLSNGVDETQVMWYFSISGDTLDMGNIGNLSAGGGLSIKFPVSELNGGQPQSVLLTVLPEALGCRGEPQLYTFVILPSEIDVFIPEVFTPNGDGINDTWGISWEEEIDPTDYSIQVFNRSKGMVKELSPLNSEWNGEGLPDGVYAWVLLKNQKAERHGGLTLRRR